MLRFTAHSLIKNSRATYIRGHWPEPITQTTLSEFFKDTNYFMEPREFVNIGLDKKPALPEPKRVFQKNVVANRVKGELDPSQVDEILQILSEEIEVPPLDLDQVRLQGQPLIDLAVSAGIYRDLFGTYTPNRELVHFTREQADKMNLLIPYFWLTDQPYARVDRKPKQPDPIQYFEPLVNISARFVQDYNLDSTDGDRTTTQAHTSFYGNIIPAAEALMKPSITLDGKLLNETHSDGSILEKDFNNWTPGTVSSVNFNSEHAQKYYSIVLLNLDYVHPDSTNLHWMIANIKPSTSDSSHNYDELCEYLPVHGIQGFGYSRYVFITLQHDAKIDPSTSRVQGSLESRSFNARSFIDMHKSISLKPVGLSWFQTTWDSSSNNVFHTNLGVKAPVYEHLQTKLEKKPEKAYPGTIPFNIYLDHVQDKKTINKQVLLERLKNVDPFDYKDQYVPPKVPPTVFQEDMPSWMKTRIIKNKNKLGYWRGLRPASALLPLDNNADLDYPLRPVVPSTKVPPEYHNQYSGKKKYKPFNSLPHSKPTSEHESVYVQDSHEIHLDQVRKVMNNFKAPKESPR